MARPHLIFLLADQLRFDVLGCYGGAGLHQRTVTPNLDQLGRHATVFDAHYTPAPLCVPARTSLMTGLSPHEHGAIINGWRPSERHRGLLKPGVGVLPSAIAKANYRVAHVGVQHVRAQPELPEQLADVDFFGPFNTGEHYRHLEGRGLMIGDMDAFRVPIIDFDEGKPIVQMANGVRQGVFPLREDLFYDWQLADRMVEAIEGHSGREPLALFGNFWLPHPPLWAPNRWATMIDPESIRLPSNVGVWYRGQPPMQLDNIPGRLGSPIGRDAWKPVWATYLGMVALLDHCVGRVLAALKETDMIADCLIVFSADHGEMLGGHAMFGKHCLYEESARVPLIVRTPGQSNPRRVAALSDHLDLAATLADYAGVKDWPQGGSSAVRDTAAVGSSLQTRSLRAIAEGFNASTDSKAAVFASYDGNAGRGFAHRMVRTSSHKFIYNVTDRDELYDLIEDPREAKNLVGREEVAAVEAHLRRLLSDWMDRTGDDQPRCRPTGEWIK